MDTDPNNKRKKATSYEQRAKRLKQFTQNRGKESIPTASMASDPNDSDQGLPVSKRERTHVPKPYAIEFSAQEIASEERRPKRKVAIMIGYSGTGYKGLQLNPGQPTIERDLFAALVAAGAISKANANDPTKSSLTRCARTDKGVHAAGNVLSMKLIIEDANIVDKINEKLDPRIRVWGIEQATGGFNCYTACDSRWYEYLIPSSAFLPPHPTSWLFRQVCKIATQDNKLADLIRQQQKDDVTLFWETVDRSKVVPILDKMEPALRNRVHHALFSHVDISLGEDEESQELARMIDEDEEEEENDHDHDHDGEKMQKAIREIDPDVKEALGKVKLIYLATRQAYRISPSRLNRIKQGFARYEGTHNFHNFTIRKSAHDPSASRVIKSFKVNGDPIVINGSEWISLKVHGQSFMMHQIRKMVALIALLIRCETPMSVLDDAMSGEIINIPKAPSLGLLLERPVFDTYNVKAASNQRGPIDFANYEEKMLEFKKEQIYKHIFSQEHEHSVFSNFFNHVDNYREKTFLYLTCRGVAATEGGKDILRVADSRGKRARYNGKVFVYQPKNRNVEAREESTTP